MIQFDKNNFNIKTETGFDNGDGWSSTLRAVFVSDYKMVQDYKSLAGYLRIPIVLQGEVRPRCMLVNKKEPKCIAERARNMIWFSNYQKQNNLEGSDFSYCKIFYEGKEDKEWYAYANCLMKFVDYILPYLREKIKDVTIDNLVYADHAQQNGAKVSFHILYTAEDPREFEVLWRLYIEFLERREEKEKQESEAEKNKESDEKTQPEKTEKQKKTVGEKPNEFSHGDAKETKENRNCNLVELEDGSVMNKETGEIVKESDVNQEELQKELQDEINEDFTGETEKENNDVNYKEEDVNDMYFDDSDDDEYAEEEEDEDN